MKNIAELVKEYREKAGLKSIELAELIGISQATISLIENGKRKPSSEVLDKIVAALNIPYEFAKESKTLSNSRVNNNEVHYTEGSLSRFNFGLGVTEVIVEITSEIDKSIDLENLPKKEVEKIKREYVFESSIVVSTLTEFINSHEEEIKKLTIENLKAEIDKLKSQYSFGEES